MNELPRLAKEAKRKTKTRILTVFTSPRETAPGCPQCRAVRRSRVVWPP